jgi:flagellar hook-associated protein 1 FlgK
MSLNAALATASRSMDLFSLGIQVSGNNISNAHTPGYVRNSLIIEEGEPVRQGNLLIGTGAFAAGIRRDVDAYLDSRIYQANGEFELSRTLSDAYQQLEGTLQSLGEEDLAAELAKFLGAIQSAVNQPEDAAIRSVMVSQGQAFAENIQLLRGRLEDLAAGMTLGIEAAVTKVNELLTTIHRLNPQIGEMEANGLNQNQAGSLRDQRAQALDELSQLIPVRAVERPDGSVDIYAGNEYLILGATLQTLETVVTNQNGVIGLHVQTAGTHAQLGTSGGKLTGLIEGRDNVVEGFIAQLDRFAAATIFEFNKLHASGEGTAGFTSATGTYVVDNPGAALDSAGLPFNPQNGSFQIKVYNTGTGLAVATNIGVNLDGIGAETTLASLQSEIDGIDHITATITADGRLQITADAGFEFRFSNDTSGALAALGINTFFTGKDAADIRVNDVVAADARFLATGLGGGPSDNQNAVRLAQAFDQAVASLDQLSISGFLNRANSEVAQKSAAQRALAEGLQSFRDVLTAQREQASGVSLDEELIKILQFQHSFQAAARIVSTVELLMNTLLQI